MEAALQAEAVAAALVSTTPTVPFRDMIAKKNCSSHRDHVEQNAPRPLTPPFPDHLKLAAVPPLSEERLPPPTPPQPPRQASGRMQHQTCTVVFLINSVTFMSCRYEVSAHFLTLGHRKLLFV